MLNAKKNKFYELYGELNPEQKKAVNLIEGPVMVIAGPGTGKTHLLGMRIANILDKTDTLPESILALTFTESGVSSMRRKLSGIIGSDAFRVEIYTFHSFANKVIKDYPDEFEEIIGANSLNDVEQINILKEIIEKTKLKNLKPFGDNYFYLRPAISCISELKRQGIYFEEFKKITAKKEKEFLARQDLHYESGKYKGQMRGKYLLEKKQIERNAELAVIYERYQKELMVRRFYDYGDMIMKVVQTLQSNKELLLILQEQYQYILVDEHQDTNNAQNKILELLANYYNNPNLFIVGDEKQAIFRFQGASAENFHYFKNLYKNVKIISLQSNYRSSQTILNAAFDVNSAGGNLLAKSKRKNDPISLRVFNDPDEELYYLAEDILKNPEQEIAVLYRENKEAFCIARMFEKRGISFTIESDQNVMDDEDIGKLFIILKAVQNFGSGQEFIEMLHLGFLNVSALDIYKIAKDPYEFASQNKSSEVVYNIYQKLSRWKKGSLNEDAVCVFEEIVRDSGFLNYLLSKPSAVEKIKKLHTIFNQLKSLVLGNKNYVLKDFFRYLDVLKEQNIFLRSESIYSPDKVRLMTAHKSKGLEFDLVYIVNANNSQWGFKRGRNYIKLPQEISGPENDDDRNLFYVAMTRARKRIIISYSNYNMDGREQFCTKFLQDIKEEYIQKESAAKKDFDRRVEFAPSPLRSSTAKDKSLLNELFLKYGLSSTALNNYLECPWKYFYRNLIRIPESPNKHLMFGSAVHNAFKAFFDRLIKGDNLTLDHLITSFENSLNFQPLQEKDYTEALEKGKKVLTGYFDRYSSSWKTNIFSEFGIRGIELSENVVINGKIDKIEVLDLANNVSVVDYKTGKPKTRNELEGKNKNSNGNYKRQLVFYKLLLDNYQNGKFKAQTGEIDFVEPDEKGRYKKEIFEINKKDAEELKEKIISVSKEIINLDFWNKSCNDSKCVYCNMRKLLIK